MIIKIKRDIGDNKNACGASAELIPIINQILSLIDENRILPQIQCTIM